jgi:hypothetical protein
MSNTAPASIRPGNTDPSDHINKYILESKIGGVPVILHIDLATVLTPFNSTQLTLRYDALDELVGLVRIAGVVGGGQITFSAGQVEVHGPIKEGPPDGHTFVGTGIWIVG